MARIYHYTSIDTLKIILETKKFRFNRLDFVDDKEEAMYAAGNSDVKIGKYIFVSCWTKEKEENPTLWEYIKEKVGGRNAISLSLDEDMFISYPIDNTDYRTFFEHHFESESDCFFHYYANTVQLHDIQYVDNVEERVRDLIKEGHDIVKIKIKELGLYKNRTIWGNEKESRFRLVAFPTTDRFMSRNHEMGEENVNFTINLMASVLPLLKRNLPISLHYKDIPLKENVLNSIKVTMGPETNDEDKDRVRQILYTSCPISRFFLYRRIADSCLKDKTNK